MICPKCHSSNVVENGSIHNHKPKFSPPVNFPVMARVLGLSLIVDFIQLFDPAEWRTFRSSAPSFGSQENLQEAKSWCLF